MKRAFTFCILLLCLSVKAKADHITGGEIYYKFVSSVNGSNTYNVTFKLFMRCNSGRQFNNPTIVSIFDKGTNQRVADKNINLSSSQTIQLTNPSPCITNPPTVCYVVGYYNFSVTLPANENGYTLSSQVNYRIQGINNLQSGYSNIGATYTAEIPGTTAAQNNSAQFTGSDLVVVCANNRFSYSFGATDLDSDQLQYSFCGAYRSGITGNTVSPPPEPPYQPVPYGSGFNQNAPLGNNVQIDSQTGLITGVAPASGVYVVTVCVQEVRNGKVIATQRKDLQINIAPCNIAAAILEPEYMLCKNTKTISLTNLSNSPLVQTYYWEITSNSGAIVFSATDPNPTYTFADTGIYTIKLSINRGQTCKDSTTSIARVYPGFVPAFNFTGICYNKPTFFKDLTTSAYGNVNSWNWAFGTGDTSNRQNPVFTYTAKGVNNVQLIVTNSVGCRDTVTHAVDIVTEPPIKLAFKDTLICKGDPLLLHAEGSGNFTWTPDYNITNAGSANPTVAPAATTTYTVNLNDNGCLNHDTILVRVTDHVDLRMMNDTTICSGDTIRLETTSNGFTYAWSPANQILTPGIKSPFVITKNKTTYNVRANIGSCLATGNVAVSTVPFPFAYAGRDTVICYNTSANINAIANGDNISWTPSIGLNNASIINPVASPGKTTSYILHVYENRGCPKPGMDTILITVLPPIAAFAGRDTSAVIEQPLQLNATGGVRYVWSPNIGLYTTNIANPIALYTETFNQVKYKVLVYNEANCADSAYVTVKIFNTGPSVFVPTAFTPNGDGRNDILRPVAAGIREIEYFKVFNRWGQEVFSTSVNGKGWDGTINGTAQSTGVYVWVVKATDYKGAPYIKKGTVTLIK